MNLVERFRGYVVDYALTRPSFEPTWLDRRAILQTGLSATPTARQLVEMGDRLSNAQRDPAEAGRGQGSVSASGISWMALVTYYLNVLYAGTDAVAVARATAPRSVKEALKVSYGGASVEGDIDVALLVLPDVSVRDEPGGTTPKRRYKAAKDEFASMFDAGFNNAYVCLIACKTNWNDLTQTPMLWNLLYSMRAAGGALPAGLAIGSGGFSLDQLAGFSFAFVTVPTNDRANYGALRSTVQRARTFTGGYYWGYPATAVTPNVQSFLDRQGSINPLVPPSNRGGVGFATELRAGGGAVDLPAFRWM